MSVDSRTAHWTTCLEIFNADTNTDQSGVVEASRKPSTIFNQRLNSSQACGGLFLLFSQTNYAHINTTHNKIFQGVWEFNGSCLGWELHRDHIWVSYNEDGSKHWPALRMSHWSPPPFACWDQSLVRLYLAKMSATLSWSNLREPLPPMLDHQEVLQVTKAIRLALWQFRFDAEHVSAKF